MRKLLTLEFWSHWAPWMVIAYLGLTFTVAAAFTLNSRTLRDEAIREAEAQSAKDAAVARCLASRPQTRRISKHVLGVNQAFTVLVQNSAAILAQTPKTDPTYKVRRANLHRLVKARENVKAITSFPVPTVAECRSRGLE